MVHDDGRQQDRHTATAVGAAGLPADCDALKPATCPLQRSSGRPQQRRFGQTPSGLSSNCKAAPVSAPVSSQTSGIEARRSSIEHSKVSPSPLTHPIIGMSARIAARSGRLREPCLSVVGEIVGPSRWWVYPLRPRSSGLPRTPDPPSASRHRPASLLVATHDRSGVQGQTLLVVRELASFPVLMHYGGRLVRQPQPRRPVDVQLAELSTGPHFRSWWCSNSPLAGLEPGVELHSGLTGRGFKSAFGGLGIAPGNMSSAGFGPIRELRS